MEKLLILGAGVYQVPLIEKARELGLELIVVSRKGDYPGFKMADKVYFIDTTDFDEVLKIAQKEGIKGICTTGSDVPIVTLGKVSEILNLPGLSEIAARLSTDKLLMKKCFKNKGVRTADFAVVRASERVEEKIAHLRLPLICKVVDSSGSRGILKIKKHSDARSVIDKLKNQTRKDYFVIEEFIEGMEFGAQAFVYNGAIKFILPHGDFVFRGDTNVPIGHFAPIRLKEEVLIDIKNQLSKAIKALMIDNSAINADFILKNNKVFVLEIGARAGATCLPELVSTYYGFDYYKTIVKVAVGEKPNFVFKDKQPNASILLFSDRIGTIKEIINKNVNDKNIVDIKFDYSIGHMVNKFKVGPDRLGHIIVKECTLKKALKLLRSVRNNIQIKVDHA